MSILLPVYTVKNVIVIKLDLELTLFCLQIYNFKKRKERNISSENEG